VLFKDEYKYNTICRDSERTWDLLNFTYCFLEVVFLNNTSSLFSSLYTKEFCQVVSLHFGGADFESCQKVTSVLELPIWSLISTLGIMIEVILVVFS
jgi:hypothetical protein